MLIAKLRISMKDANIQYNKGVELGTDKKRGTVLEDGKVIRGLGTHFANKESQERYDKLTRDGNIVRTKFNKRFLRTPIEGTFIIVNKGEAKKYIESLEMNPELDVSVIEFELGAPDSLDAKEMMEWGSRVKAQLVAVAQLGRGDGIKGDGLDSLETLAGCPVLSADTADKIRNMISQVRAGQLDKVEFKRSIAMLEVSMDQTQLSETVSVKRGGLIV